MIIIGADYHPGFQQIAFVDTETGDCGEQRLQHREEAEKLPRSRSPGNEGARGDGSQWACTLVRATAGGAEHRVMDWRRGGDSHETGAQAEDGWRGCPAAAALDAGRSLSADLGSELGESRSAATAVAPAPDGAGAHPVDEPVASGSSERRAALQEEVMAGARTGTTGV